MSGDLISRDAVLKEINCWIGSGEYRYAMSERFLLDRIKQLPSVTLQEPKYCDRNICIKNEYNGIGCDECEVTKSQELSSDLIRRQTVKEQMIKYGFHAPDMTVTEFIENLPSVNPQKNIVNNGTMNITL